MHPIGESSGDTRDEHAEDILLEEATSDDEKGEAKAQAMEANTMLTEYVVEEITDERGTLKHGTNEYLICGNSP